MPSGSAPLVFPVVRLNGPCALTPEVADTKIPVGGAKTKASMSPDTIVPVALTKAEPSKARSACRMPLIKPARDTSHPFAEPASSKVRQKLTLAEAMDVTKKSTSTDPIARANALDAPVSPSVPRFDLAWFVVDAIPKFLAFVGFKASVGAEQGDETTAGLKSEQYRFDVPEAKV